MPVTLWAMENEHGRGYIYIGGDRRFNAYLRCECSDGKPRYKHFMEMAKAQAWITRHLEKHVAK